MIYLYNVNEDVINHQFKSYSSVIVFVCIVVWFAKTAIKEVK